MLGPANPLILCLDPDHDFLNDMNDEAKARQVQFVIQPYSHRNPVDLESLMLQYYPDIVVANLDQGADKDFGHIINEILRIPTPLTPIILGTTNHESLSLKTKAYQMGIDDYLIRPVTPREVWLRLDVLLRTRRLQKQLDEATRKLSTANLQLNSSNRHLEEMTLTDELTGLNNMRFMSQYLEKQFHMFSRNQRSFCIMMIDLDHFKEVNDQNDHLVGSETIKAVGQIIQKSTRGGDVKARYGGDEYIVAMPETDEKGARVVGERIRQAVQNHVIKGNNDRDFQVTSSIGIGIFQCDKHLSFKDVIREADYALYVAKEQGRNRVIVYDPQTHKAAAEKSGYDETQSGVLSELKKMKA